jgi:hypothetical protein
MPSGALVIPVARPLTGSAIDPPAQSGQNAPGDRKGFIVFRNQNRNIAESSPPGNGGRPASPAQTSGGAGRSLEP